MLHEAGLSINDLKMLNFGTALDYVYQYIEFHKPKAKATEKQTKNSSREPTPEEVKKLFGIK